jgi:hypothetical protein
MVEAVLDETPGYPPDQVPRKLRFEADHPQVRITFCGPYWRAVIPRDGGEETVTGLDLRWLLDALEELA